MKPIPFRQLKARVKRGNYLLELLHDGGCFPSISPENACSLDWLHLLSERQAELLRIAKQESLPDEEQEQDEDDLRFQLAKMVVICEAWDARIVRDMKGGAK